VKQSDLFSHLTQSKYDRQTDRQTDRTALGGASLLPVTDRQRLEAVIRRAYETFDPRTLILQPVIPG